MREIRITSREEFVTALSSYLKVDVPDSLVVEERSTLQLMNKDDIGGIIAEGSKQSFFGSAVLDDVNGRVFSNIIVPLSFCEDHFPDYPMLPMAKLGQIMAQVGSILVLSVDDENSKDHGKMMALAASVEGIKSFTPKINGRRKPFIIPGDNLLLVAEFSGDKLSTKSTLVSVYVSGQLINTMALTYTVMPFDLFKKIYERQQPT